MFLWKTHLDYFCTSIKIFGWGPNRNPSNFPLRLNILMAAHFGFMRTITRYNEKRKLIMICFFLLMLRMLALKIVFGPLRKHANINQELLLQLVTRWLNYVIVFDKHGNYWWNISFLNELQKNMNVEPNFYMLFISFKYQTYRHMICVWC